MTPVPVWIAIALGGAVGAAARYGATRMALKTLGPNYPWGTLIVNAAGSFLMGIAVVFLAARAVDSAALRGFLTIGVLGAFTTFSTFSLDAVMLLQGRDYWGAAGYLAGSLVFSVGGLVLGFLLAKAVT